MTKLQAMPHHEWIIRLEKNLMVIKMYGIKFSKKLALINYVRVVSRRAEWEDACFLGKKIKQIRDEVFNITIIVIKNK